MKLASRFAFSALLALAGSPGLGAEAERGLAGQLADGTAVEAVTLSNENGVSATILTYGATLQAFPAPDANGAVADITLGYDSVADYEAFPDYFGVTVGRYANRIKSQPRNLLSIARSKSALSLSRPSRSR